MEPPLAMRNYSDRKLREEQFDTSGRKSGGVSTACHFSKHDIERVCGSQALYAKLFLIFTHAACMLIDAVTYSKSLCCNML